jgi:hypothetical protein
LNYNEANKGYMTASKFKRFVGMKGNPGCEARAMAIESGQWTEETNDAMLVGSYVDSYFTGDLEQFKQDNPQIFSSKGPTKGELKATFQIADKMIQRAERDKFFMTYLEGEKQKTMATEIFGIKWRGTLDVLGKDRIVDLKTVKEVRSRHWTPDEGTLSLVRYWGYDIQGALYQEMVYQETGRRLPVYLAMISKEQYPDLAIVKLEDHVLRFALEWVKMNSFRLKRVFEGEFTPDRCERCDYCKETRELSIFDIINSDDLV